MFDYKPVHASFQHRIITNLW